MNLSIENMVAFIKFAFPNNSGQNPIECSTELARGHLEAYIQASRIDSDYILHMPLFVEALIKSGFKANDNTCSITVANMKLLEAVNNITMDEEIANKVRQDPEFLFFICTSIRQFLENEPMVKEYKVMYDNLQTKRAFMYQSDLYTVHLLSDCLVIKKEPNLLIESNN